ncbi:MAG: hypothetical protein D6B26_01205 [Spirochaetaceae bacterium]|nr:MAG: hypothetical protein D6B26_01205 [Spirochaetaceae bacterium]
MSKCRFLLLPALGVLCLICNACIPPYSARKIEVNPIHPEKGLTLFLYMAADNELEPYAIQDLVALEQSVAFFDDDVSILALLDRPAGARLYHLRPLSSPANGTIQSPPIDSSFLGLSDAAPMPVNMGEPWTLKQFIRHGVNSFPAQNYAMVIWGHGSGWRSQPTDKQADYVVRTKGVNRALAYDDGSSDALYTSQLADGLSELQELTAQKWGLIGFEICHGMMLEVLYELRNITDYAAGSVDIVAAAGWDWMSIGSDLPTADVTDSLTLGELLCQAFAAAYPTTNNAAFSVVKLDKIQAINDCWNKFSQAVLDGISADELRRQARDILFLQTEDHFEIPGDLNIDLADAAAKIAVLLPSVGQASSAVNTLVQDAVVSNFTSINGNPESHGIAVHLVPLNEHGAAMLPHDLAYIKGSNADYPLEFVEDSDWVLSVDGSGLLHRIWYGE